MIVLPDEDASQEKNCTSKANSKPGEDSSVIPDSHICHPEPE
jgi:hypothetical protein